MYPKVFMFVYKICPSAPECPSVHNVPEEKNILHNLKKTCVYVAFETNISIYNGLYV